MPEPIRIIHFADAHVGMENYGRTDPRTGLSSRVVDFLRRLDDICQYAQDEDIDLVIFAGDAFKTRSPNPTYQREFAHRVRDLAAIAPVVLLVGNHDVAPARMKASSIEIYDTLAVPNVWVADGYEVRQIDTRRGPVAVGSAPYPIRARILEEITTAGMTVGQTDNILQEQLVTILDEMAAEADALGDMPRLLTGHFTIGGALVGSERNIMLGRDVAVPRAILADPRWDYVAMGHIHKHQNLTEGRDDVPPVVYSGSLERIDFGEEGDPKGFCRVDLARGATEWRFVELGARPFVTLRADLRDVDNPTTAVLRKIERHDLKNAVVRVHLEMTQDSQTRLDENAIRDALHRAGTFSIASIHKQIEQPDRARLGASPEGLNNMELLERYLISTSTPQERRDELLDLARQIMDEVENGGS
ncbi:MAG: metallophosphoesterase family protein [Chloroflexota bacterium]